MTTSSSGYSGAVPSAERFVVPDLARGIALLGIALANCVFYVSGRDTGPLGRPVDGSAADRVTDVIVGVFVDNRSFPLFTLLFAYGLTVLMSRQAARNVPYGAARLLLVKRSLWLVVFGALHMVLLFTGDILLSYGALGLVIALLFTATERVLRIIAWSTLPVFALFAGFDGIAGLTGADAQLIPGIDPTTFVGAAIERVVTAVGSVFAAPIIAATFLPVAIIGLLLGRRRVLQNPHEHLPLLRRFALVGMPVSVLGAIPLVVAAIGLWQPPGFVLYLLGIVHGVTGIAGAVGLVGMIGWFVGSRAAAGPGATATSSTDPAAGPPSRPLRGVGAVFVAVGKRSLTCYLLQSVLFVPLLSPWALGLGVGAGTFELSMIAIGVYAVTLVVAVLLEQVGRQGPAEALLRRLTYGRPA